MKFSPMKLKVLLGVMAVICLVPLVCTAQVSSLRIDPAVDTIPFRMLWSMLNDRTAFVYEFGQLRVGSEKVKRYLKFVEVTSGDSDGIFQSAYFTTLTNHDTVAFRREMSFQSREGEKTPAQPDTDYFNSRSRITYLVQLCDECGDSVQLLDSLCCRISPVHHWLYFTTMNNTPLFAKAVLRAAIGKRYCIKVELHQDLPIGSRLVSNESRGEHSAAYEVIDYGERQYAPDPARADPYK